MKVAINSYATENPNFIAESVKNFGTSTIVIYIETKYNPETMAWEVYKYSGRERSGIKLVDWIQKIQDMGCGEIMLTSIDREGTGSGFELDLIKKVSDIVSIPIIAHGGASSPKHIIESIKYGGADAVSVSSMLHYSKNNFKNDQLDTFHEEGNIEFLKKKSSFKIFGNENLETIKYSMIEKNILTREL